MYLEWPLHRYGGYAESSAQDALGGFPNQPYGDPRTIKYQRTQDKGSEANKRGFRLEWPVSLSAASATVLSIVKRSALRFAGFMRCALGGGDHIDFL